MNPKGTTPATQSPYAQKPFRGTLLITGGSGFIGRELTQQAQQQGYAVRWLSRDVNIPAPEGVKVFAWNVNNKSMDYTVWEGVTHVVHLAGTNIGEKSWNAVVKNNILKSRERGNAVLHGYALKYAQDLKVVVAASGIGWYGNAGADHIWTETEGPGTGFQADVCKKWEFGVVESWTNLNVRPVILRTGIVLHPSGGALPKMITPARLGIGHLGNGKQWVSWISRHDHVRLILFALEQGSMNGVYNAVAPEPVTNATLTKVIAKSYKAFTWFPFVPAFMLKLVLGEMSELVLGSIRVSAQKVLDAGFTFRDAKLTHVGDDL